MLDIHCHILPCVDDGASSLEEALCMARLAVQDGITKIVCTPHVTPSPDAVEQLEHHAKVRHDLQQVLVKEGIELELLGGAELMLTPDLFSFVKKNPLARLAGTKAFLFEITPFIPLHAIPSMLFSAKLAGLQVIFAHPERYPQVIADCSFIEKICEQGALLQLTAMSLTGEFGQDVQRCAQKLIQQFPDHIVVASDSHDKEFRKPLLSAAYEILPKQVRLSAQEHYQRIFAL